MPSIDAQLLANTELFEREFETITHNLANANTAGFKRLGNSFVATLNLYNAATAPPDTPPVETLNLVQRTDFAQGKLVHTGRSLDLALSGSGFFTIETPAGPMYTRSGVFHLDANGQLVNSDGHTVAGMTGPITLPPSAVLEQIEITPDGSIRSGTQPVGRLRLSQFPDNEHNLTVAGTSEFYAPPDLVPQPAGSDLAVHQGYQEASNVNTMKELVGMMSVARLYEANMNYITARKEASQALMQVAMG